jgi:hypothetical protein
MALRVLIRLGAPASSAGLWQAVTRCVQDRNWVVREAASECVGCLLAARQEPVTVAYEEMSGGEGLGRILLRAARSGQSSGQGLAQECDWAPTLARGDAVARIRLC